MTTRILEQASGSNIFIVSMMMLADESKSEQADIVCKIGVPSPKSSENWSVHYYKIRITNLSNINCYVSKVGLSKMIDYILYLPNTSNERR